MACALLQCPVELEEVETAGQLHEVGEAGSPYAGAEGRTKERPHQPHGAGLGASGAACEREAVEALKKAKGSARKRKKEKPVVELAM